MLIQFCKEIQKLFEAFKRHPSGQKRFRTTININCQVCPDF